MRLCHIFLVKKTFSVYYLTLDKMDERRRSQVAKAVVCKTIIQRFKSARRLHYISGLPFCFPFVSQIAFSSTNKKSGYTPDFLLVLLPPC